MEGGERVKIAYAAQVPLPSHRAQAVHVMRMCSAFARAGHEVELFTEPGNTSVPNIFDHYGLPEAFSIHHVRQSRLRGWGAFQFARDIVRSAGSREALSLIYARHIHTAVLAARRGVPVIFEAHMPPSNALHAILMRHLFALDAWRGLVVITESLRQEYLKRFPRLDPSRVLVAHDGADLPPEVPASALTDSKSAFRVGYVGNLYPGKGIEIITQIAGRMPEVEFHVVGGRTAEVEDWRSRCEGDCRVVFHGEVRNAEVGNYLSAFDLVLLPAQSRVSPDGGSADISAWTSPMKLFEYMAHECVIIASDLPVLQEVLTNERNALIVRHDDPRAWVGAIERLRADPALGHRLAAQARQDLAAQYTWTARANRVLEFAMGSDA